MILKYTLSNMFQKPARLIILMLCMITACLFGFLAMDFSGNLKDLLAASFSYDAGDADYIVASLGKDGIEGVDLSGAGPVRICYRSFVKKTEIKRQESEYDHGISAAAEIWVLGDYETAVEMQLVPSGVTAGFGEIAIGKRYSEDFGIGIGDTIILKSSEDEEVPFTVSCIFAESGVWEEGYKGMITPDSAKQLLKGKGFRQAYVDLVDNNFTEFEEYMTAEHPALTVLPTYAADYVLEVLNHVGYVVYLLFVLVFALVIFVTISFTEKILTERMSVIGTLRSIGMSMKKTTFILLFENVLYGVMGSVFGLILYLILRAVLVAVAMEDFVDDAMGTISIPRFLIVIAATILIQVLIPLKEVLKAVKTSIRDIIFENRDSDSKVSVKKTIAGVVLIVFGVAAGLLVENIVMDIICILLVIVGGSLIITFLVRKLTEKLAVAFGKAGMPVAELAAVECGTKKPNNGNAILTIVAVTASIAIFVMGSSVIYGMNKPDYDTDVVITGTEEQRAEDYSYLDDYDSITEKEFIMSQWEYIGYTPDKNAGFVIWSLPSTGQYIGFGKLPESLGKNEMVLNRNAAQLMRVKAGDTVKLTFHDDGLFPQEMELRVAEITKENRFDPSFVIILNPETYKELYYDSVSMILIRTTEPERLADQLDAAMTDGETIKTNEKILAETKDDNDIINLILYAVTFAAMGLTIVGISGNQMIGFVGRKKEYAMLHSTACSRKKIVRMIWIENALLFGIAVICAAVISVPVVLLIARVFRLTNLGLFVEVRFDALIGCAFLLWLVTMLTARTPIRGLKKMNTAVEMKYE